MFAGELINLDVGSDVNPRGRGGVIATWVGDASGTGVTGEMFEGVCIATVAARPAGDVGVGTRLTEPWVVHLREA